MRRPRNKVAALPLELRRRVAAALLDGETYDQIRRTLSAKGVQGDRMPGNSAFAAYRNGSEYQDLRAERLRIEDKHAEQRRLREALKSADAIGDQAQIMIYVAMEKAMSALKDDAADPAVILRAISGVQKVLNETAKLQHRREVEETASAPEEAKALTGDELVDAFDERMGLKPKGAK